MTDLITLREVASMLGVSYRCAAKYANPDESGAVKIKRHSIRAGVILVARSEVEKIIKARSDAIRLAFPQLVRYTVPMETR